MYSEDKNNEENKEETTNKVVNITPNVIMDNSLMLKESLLSNSKYDVLYSPFIGPQKITTGQTKDIGGCLTGTADKFNLNTTVFEQNYENYYKELKKNKIKIKKRKKINDPTHSEYKGPWEKSKIEDFVVTKEDEEKYQDFEFVEFTEEEEQEIEKLSVKKFKPEDVKKIDFVDSSIYHLDEEFDYQGRSFVQHPTHIKEDEKKQNFLPKKWIHTWSGHQKAVTRVQFFPKYGHLLLSSSMDHSIKIWDVNEHKKNIRTYLGHTEGK
jgi:WD40 repeat protein